MAMNNNLQNNVLQILSNWRGIESLKKLLSQLNYDFIYNQPIPRRDWSQTANQALVEDPLLSAKAGDFHIIYCHLTNDRIRLTDERAVVNRLLREHPYSLFVFSNKSQTHWHLVNVKEGAKQHDEADEKKVRRLLRRISIGPEERYRTASERIVMLDVASIQRELFAGVHPLELQKRHDEAFDVEQVAKAFFEDYKAVFSAIQNELRRQTRNKVWAHDYALQMLNRLIFLYFIQRKKWLGDNPNFIRDFWEAYKDYNESKNTFFDKWLSILFFEAFNAKFQAGRADRKYFPHEIRQALANAPYLNGGLFARNKLDDAHGFNIPDSTFDRIFDFLEGYNFTIREDSPFDQEVAVDPEMIGKVYESLVNITFEGIEEEDRRGSAGIFYTPRVEIDLMCRLSLVDWLANHLGEEHNPLLYEAIFAYDPDEKQAADNELMKQNLWEQLNSLLRNITVLDPACGSGSFLVGMLNALDDLLERAKDQLGIPETDYDRCKHIIGHSLYGVDVMPWAVHVAELRLWLQLVVEVDLEWWELKARPLLPNLSFKIRPGDSLVQEVGGINFSLHRTRLDIPSSLKGQITKLKGEKLKFFQGQHGDIERKRQQLEREEQLLFREILSAKRNAIDNRLVDINRMLGQTQTDFIGGETKAVKDKDARDIEQEKQSLEMEKEQLVKALEAMKTAQDVPFVWDIAFVEIFEGDKGGFDIVIGNPPYVRQEKIAPPMLREEDNTSQWQQLKRDYKSKLQLSVATAYPRFFNYKPEKNQFRKLDGKSDLYVYFYLHGLSLLNSKGSFCFITSNSWLDVGYGKDLQEFLLKHGHVKMIVDNESKRTFAQADINTIIALLSAPDDSKSKGLDKTARFVMFKVPFASVLSPVVFQEIEETTDRLIRHEFRVIVRNQKALYEEGLSVPDEEDDARRSAIYEGNKWGGKYLRAPEIFFTILEKGRGKLVRLGDIAEVRRGFTTGANDFFYLDEEKIREWRIEEEFLKPFLFSLKEISKYEVESKSLKRKIFICHETKNTLRQRGKHGTLQYILWGEERGFHQRPSCRGRSPWYSLPNQISPHFVSNRFLGKRFGFPWVEQIAVCDVFFIGRFYQDDGFACTALLNSSISFLSAEVLARKTYGIGVAYLYGPEIRGVYMLNPSAIQGQARQELVVAFNNMKQRELLKVEDEFQCSDRHELDNIIFDVLNLTQSERAAVYEAVVELVKRRLEKAQSVRK